MTLAVTAHWFWNWIAGGLRGIKGLFRRKQKRRKVSLTKLLNGSVLRKCFDSVSIVGTVIRQVEKDVGLVGENFTGIVLDLLFEEGD